MGFMKGTLLDRESSKRQHGFISHCGSCVGVWIERYWIGTLPLWNTQIVFFPLRKKTSCEIKSDTITAKLIFKENFIFNLGHSNLWSVNLTFILFLL